jgi:uncharacterized membrane protein YesL
MAAGRVLWLALLGLYDETLTLVASNLLWIGLNLPILLFLGLIVLVTTPLDPVVILSGLAALLVLLPTPAGVALAGVARVAAGPDAPSLDVFWRALRTRWRLGLACCTVSVGAGLLLLMNVLFWPNFPVEWLRFATIPWLYGTLFWLSLHVYIAPLLVHVPEPRLIDLYRRAALIALGHPVLTLVLFGAQLVIGVASVIFLPVYLLAGGAYVSLIQAHALREVRRRHGDLVAETEDEG